MTNKLKKEVEMSYWLTDDELRQPAVLTAIRVSEWFFFFQKFLEFNFHFLLAFVRNAFIDFYDLLIV